MSQQSVQVQVVMEVYRITRAFPQAELFGLTSQVRRAAISTASNIVEGCARYSEADFLRFLDMSYGSAKEVEYQLSIADRLGYSQELAEVRKMCNETAKVLNGLIRSIRSPLPLGQWHIHLTLGGRSES